MKQNFQLLVVALLSGILTLGGYKYLENSKTSPFTTPLTTEKSVPFVQTNFTGSAAEMDTDFTQAAEMTVHAVVHVKNITVSHQPTNIFEFFQGGGRPRAMIGSGSGVIVSPDGYIVTNNHVIANASSLEVTLNDNRTYPAKLIGTDPGTDIALIKIDGEEDFPFVPFGDSNNVRL